MPNRCLSLFAGLCVGLLVPAVCHSANQPAAGGVRVWEETLTIPTYLTKPPDLSPIFYDGRNYVATKGRVYPYPITDQLTDVREDRQYRAIYLENRYVKLCITPELGGRLFSAVDKTNGYDFFYRQHVMKPALIGMLGAWTSGGVEWNVPHIHRSTAYLPVDSEVVENPDGSKTIWVGEIEIRHRMKWMVGVTLHPDRSYLETTMKLINRTPAAQSFIYFINAAVHADGDYEVIFPPSTEFVTGHSKLRFQRWPIDDGVDISRRINHRRPNTMFAFESEENFFAGYSHDEEAGVVHVADHRVMPGKKYFTWGVGRSGQIWDRTLTDSDGPYVEIMAGGYSDNQPDYIWIEPYETKTVSDYWYPFQQIGGVKNATADAAVNLEVDPGVARVGFCTSAEYPGASVVVRAGDRALLEKTVDISPENPYTDEIELPAGVAEEDLLVSLAAGDRQLVSYQPQRRESSPMPKPAEPPPAPKEIDTIEELYLTGLRLHQFIAAAAEPEPYFEEALRRDPGDYRSNLELGKLLWKRGRFEEARERFQAAVARASSNYTQPKDGEAHYYLGIAQKFLGDHEAAEKTLHQAAWSYAWQSASYFTLAELATLKGDYREAVGLLDKSLATNASHTKALALKASLLRSLGREETAEQAAARALQVDPLDRWAQRELNLVRGRPGEWGDLEMAVDYANAGLWDDAIAVLRAMDSANPMAHYFLGYLNEKADRSAAAARHYRQASTLSPDYCFPYRLESIAVLRRAIAHNPSDARAHYYLGNLLYDRQPEAAIAAWERARALDADLPLVHRNLGFAYARHGQGLDRAIESLETAIERKPDPRFLRELDDLYRSAGVAPDKRLAMLRRHHQQVAERDDALDREIRLLIFAGEYDEALDLIGDRRFHIWEGGGRLHVHDSWVDAHLMRGHRHLRAGQPAEARRDYEAALEFPENLQMGGYGRSDRQPLIYYHLGRACQAAGESGKAAEYFRKVITTAPAIPDDQESIDAHTAENLYSLGLAFRELGRDAEAARVFDRLQDSTAATADARYAAGLAHLAADRPREATSEFRRALDKDAAHLGAHYQLSSQGQNQ